MALRKLVGRDAPIEVLNLEMTIYGPEGIGKSTLASTAADPLLIDTDSGAHRADLMDGGRRRCDVLQATTWADISSVNRQDVERYGSLVLDTAGRAIDLLGVAKQRGETLTQREWGYIKQDFVAWKSRMRATGKDLVHVCHQSVKRVNESEYRDISVQGGSSDEIKRSSDLIGRLYPQDGGVWVTFDPSSDAVGKNPAKLEPRRIDPSSGTTLADILDEAREAMRDDFAPNPDVVAFRGRLAAGPNIEEFNALAVDLRSASGLSQSDIVALGGEAKAYAAGHGWTRQSDGSYMEEGEAL